MLQKGCDLRWEDCLTESLPTAVKVGAVPRARCRDGTQQRDAAKRGGAKGTCARPRLPRCRAAACTARRLSEAPLACLVLARITGAPGRATRTPVLPLYPPLMGVLLQEGRWSEALAAIPLVTTTPETPFREAMGQLVDHKKHRWAAWPPTYHGCLMLPFLLPMARHMCPCARMACMQGPADAGLLPLSCPVGARSAVTERFCCRPAKHYRARLPGLAGYTLWMARGARLA